MKNSALKEESVIGEHLRHPPAYANPDIELLSRETQMPRALVERLYASEFAKLEKNARIKTFIPVLTHRHVKALLLEQARA